LHLMLLERRFQLSIMNNTEPSAGDLAAFENDYATLVVGDRRILVDRRDRL
jgi:hypothetical protein